MAGFFWAKMQKITKWFVTSYLHLLHLCYDLSTWEYRYLSCLLYVMIKIDLRKVEHAVP
jgi:hypothetical protein